MATRGHGYGFYAGRPSSDAKNVYVVIMQFVFALVTMLGAQTISTEYFNSIDVCLYYAERLSNQHHYHYHNGHQAEHVFAHCIPMRVDPSKVTIFER